MTNADSPMWGYARVSTPGQTDDLQRDALLAAGVPEHRIFSDVTSGSKAAASRVEFARLLDRLDPGSTLVVWRIDRLGRSLLDVLKTVAVLEERGVGVRSISDNIDPSTPTGRLLLGIFATLAEYERLLTLERIEAGMAASRARGVKPGRPAPDPVEVARKVRIIQDLIDSEGMKPREAAATVSWSQATFYRHRKNVASGALTT